MRKRRWWERLLGLGRAESAGGQFGPAETRETAPVVEGEPPPPAAKPLQSSPVVDRPAIAEVMASDSAAVVLSPDVPLTQGAPVPQPAPTPSPAPRRVSPAPKRAAPAPKQASSVARPLPKRRLHLGIDYGTAWSKMVLRDCASPRGDEAFVLRPLPPVTLEAGEFRIPSLVVSDGSRLWFGGAAHARAQLPDCHAYSSLKIRASMPEHYYGLDVAVPNGLSEKDLAILYVGFLLSLGRLAAIDYGRSQGIEPSLGFTLGVPASFSSDPSLRELFAEIGRTAWRLNTERAMWTNEGWDIAMAREELSRAKSQAAASLVTADWTQWIRNESVAALHWGFRSPRLGEGLYSAIDVGAGTTNASWFRIVAKYDHGVWEKAEFVFYGSACQASGVDRIDHELARLLGPTEDPATYRDREGELLLEVGWALKPQFSEVFKAIFKVSQLAFRSAYKKDQRQGSWSPCGLLLFGGGSQIKPLVPSLSGPAWQNLDSLPILKDPGVPSDLKEFDGSSLSGEHHLLLVAYGLSFPLGDVPEVREGDDVDDFEPWRYPSLKRIEAIEWDI